MATPAPAAGGAPRRDPAATEPARARAPGRSAAAGTAEAELAASREEIATLRLEMDSLLRSLAASERGVENAFLKSVLLRYLKMGDLENTLPVLAKAVGLSDDEVQEVRHRQPRGIVHRVTGRPVFGGWLSSGTGR